MHESGVGRTRSALLWALRRADTKAFRYLIVGGWNTLFGFALFVGLQLSVGDAIGYMAVLVIAQVLGIINAYLTYRLLVFRVRGQWWLDFWRFSAIYWLVLGINALALPVMVSGLRMNVIVAQSLFFLVTVLGSYIAHNHFSFRRTGQGED
jgi:putative flippase GtrA